MAAEVPVTDVLCEAMEYLSKLGSNLRTRSENLKEKRISKDKLRNAHAVQKAANKVLLICELSKKSLDNVETGVRKVISLLEASQASSNIGGNTSDSTSRSRQYHYFEYQSRKLRIAKKISLKHYTSVKVLAQSMPVSLQDKYPVYYNCKLKRHRKRLARKQKYELKRKRSVCTSDKEQENDNDDGKLKELDDGNQTNKINDTSTNNSINELEKKSPVTDQQENNLEDTWVSIHSTKNDGEEKESIVQSGSTGDIDKSNDEKVTKLSEEKCSDTNGNDEEKSDKNTSTSRNIQDQKHRQDSPENDDKKNTKKKSRYATIYTDSETESQKDQAEENKTNELCLDNDRGNINTNDSSIVNEPKAKKLRLNLSDDESNCSTKQTDMVNKNITKDSDCDRESNSNSMDTKSNMDSQNESGSEAKPLIRCVNLSKLLKPDILNKKDGNTNLKEKDILKTKKNKFSLNEKNIRGEKENKKLHKTKSDDAYWAQKRKEVSEFKAKKFSIKIERLPSFSQKFLLTHNLKKVIKDGIAVCKLPTELDTLNSPTMSAVKNALLNDSDSDDDRVLADTTKVKKSLLKDSDSEGKLSGKEESNESDNSSKAKKQTSISESINNALRNLDSDLENNDTVTENDAQAGDLSTKETSSPSCQDKNNESRNKKSNVDSSCETATFAKIDDGTKSLSSDKNQDEMNKEVDKVFDKLSEVEHIAKCSKTNEMLPTKNNDIEMSSEAKNNEENEKELSTETNEAEKTSVLNSFSDEDFSGFSKSDQESPNKAIQKVKSLLLRHSSDEDSADLKKNNQETPTKINQKVKDSLLNDSSDEKSDKNEDHDVATNTKNSLLNNSSEELTTPSKNKDECIDKSKELKLVIKIGNNDSYEVKSSLNNSLGDNITKGDKETPTKTNEKVKSSLLKDSSDEKSNDESSTKANEKLTSSHHNETSDVHSHASTRKEKRKTPKSKRKYARKSREARKKLKYDSSSDSEPEKHREKRIRKKSTVSNSSSSSEEIIKKSKKFKSKDSKHSSHSDSNTNKTIDQVDGPMDKQSNSSVEKMVRSKAKPSGSSSLNSDNQDSTDKDIDGLTNLKRLSKARRNDHSKNRDSTLSKHSRSKDTPLLGENLLKAESSSDISASASDVPDELEDLPPVSLPGLNGDNLVDHMAKDDLLDESDSSVSHDKNTTENTDNMDETDGEQNLKSKRRKANAISSDSEGGTHRRKTKDERMSDFSDSEDSSSEPAKKSKRKKKASDSDASLDSDGGKKKRRRIKVVNDSDMSGSDTENEGRNKHGRKNIRKVMGKNQLEEATKKAAREEKERIARIMERQKLYNNLEFDESGKPDEVVLEKVVLDFDPETKEPLIQVDRGLVKKLKPHQANGIKFMWDACFESVKRIKKDKGSGCILAHCMGLGKTLQVISLTHTLLTHGSLTGVQRVLVVCPLSTVLNWVNEFRMWLKHAEAEFDVDVYELSRYKQNSERAFQLQQWFEGGGVCVLGYEMFRNLSADNNKKFKKKMLRSFQEALVDPGPDLVVCDEGHLLKNEKTSLSQSMNRVKTRRRIVLTGTPLQNNLKEYYCMVQFVKPNLLGKYNEYLNRFVNPITNGQYTDSTEHDIRVMKRRSHVLHKMLDGAVQRRDYGVLAPFLPPKHEYVLFITLSDVQVKLYQFYLDNYSRRPLPGKSSGFLFPDFQSLQRIWTHPLVLKYNSERYEIMQQKKRDKEEEDSEGSLVDFIDDDSTPEETSTEESTDELSDVSDDSRKKSKKKKSAKKGKGKETKASTRRGTRANPVELDDEDHVNEEVSEVKRDENPTEWWIKLVEESELEDMRNSHKLVLLFDILRQCETIGDKLLVFSQSLYSLDLIEHFLGKVDEATQEGRIDEKLGGHVGSWAPGVDYFRLDGSTSCENRSIWCKNFNREDNPRARLFLISTRAGGLGINLVAANRVVIFDVSWNPSHDVQSIFRVYRFGQKKPCYIYRFLAMGTMEEKIYERQVTKQAISKRVIDEQQIDRHYAENDLAELYKFDARPEEPRPLPTLPKDRLFAEMLKEHEAQIYKYHEHDSLLENKEEETLSEEERKAAWEDFENEKSKPPPAPFPAPWPMHNGMVPGLLAQQQQQLAYAALAAMLRKDMPNINDNQIRDMLPLIYNSNPGLMQKMSEIYKYAQPSMMNPNMMNPNMMNAGSGGGGGMGGSSGLQYEPPWQRQHQQQQQMRLQQLMQQQNQMGAKFYAGGLGSRDPVAMALQQQRAREIMMGGGGATGGGARPRGRPPIHPRLPTATSNDVVNLDSD